MLKKEVCAPLIFRSSGQFLIRFCVGDLKVVAAHILMPGQCYEKVYVCTWLGGVYEDIWDFEFDRVACFYV